MRITRLSCASWFKVESECKIVHFDPGYTGLFRNQGIPENELAVCADIVLISHFHKDHLQPEVLKRIVNPKTQVIAPNICKSKVETESTSLAVGEDVVIDEVKIRAVEAYNIPQGHSTRKLHHYGDFVGYVVEIGGKVIYHAGDTDLIPEMRALGKVDIAFIPIGGTFVMDSNEALEAVKMIAPRIVIPMHEAQEDPTVFKTRVEQSGQVKVFLLQVGGSIEL